MAGLYNSLHIRRGITDKQIEQLITYSNTDKLTLKYTSDHERFKDRNAYNTWLKKGRVIYTLSSKNGDLLGIVWYGEKHMPKDLIFTKDFDKKAFGNTCSIRIYGSARGKGLSVGLMRKTYKDYLKTDKYKINPNKGFWLITFADNSPAIRAYKALGYKTVSEPDGRNRIIMIL
jgi:GNAT superfamily N-acetyltransferase